MDSPSAFERIIEHLKTLNTSIANISVTLTEGKVNLAVQPLSEKVCELENNFRKLEDRYYKLEKSFSESSVQAELQAEVPIVDDAVSDVSNELKPNPTKRLSTKS